jgi:hypothetical protein
MFLLESLLVTLVQLADSIPMPAPPTWGRGRPPVYPDRLFLKAFVIMMVWRLHKVNEFLAVLAAPTPAMHGLRGPLTNHQERMPSRWTWEHRLAAVLATLPVQIGCLGKHLEALFQRWTDSSHVAAIDSTVLRVRGGVWHKKDREAGGVPHTLIDLEAHWTTSGWHCWVYGGKLHLELRLLLEDHHDRAPDLEQRCPRRGCLAMTPTGGAHPHTDNGVEVRRILHSACSIAIENFNEQYKGIFEGHGQVPTRGLVATRRFALGASFVYQLALRSRHDIGADLRVGQSLYPRSLTMRTRPHLDRRPETPTYKGGQGREG